MARGETRLNIELNPATAELLDRIAEMAGGTTKRDVFNTALTLLGWSLAEVAKGRQIASVDEERKVYREIVMPMFEAARSLQRKKAGDAKDAADAGKADTKS